MLTSNFPSSLTFSGGEFPPQAQIQTLGAALEHWLGLHGLPAPLWEWGSGRHRIEPWLPNGNPAQGAGNVSGKNEGWRPGETPGEGNWAGAGRD